MGGLQYQSVWLRINRFPKKGETLGTRSRSPGAGKAHPGARKERNVREI